MDQVLDSKVFNAVLGGVVLALATAGPLVVDGVTAAEWINIALAFLGGTGLTALPNVRQRIERTNERDARLIESQQRR